MVIHLSFQTIPNYSLYIYLILFLIGHSNVSALVFDKSNSSLHHRYYLLAQVGRGNLNSKLIYTVNSINRLTPHFEA